MPSGVFRPVRGPRVRTNQHSTAIRATPDRDSRATRTGSRTRSPVPARSASARRPDVTTLRRAMGLSATVGTRLAPPKTAPQNG